MKFGTWLPHVCRGTAKGPGIDDRNYGYNATRGFLGPESYNDHMLIQIDGHRLNENVYDGAYVDREFPVDLDLTKSVVRAARNSRLTGAWAVHTILL